jgi:hypothetical protein
VAGGECVSLSRKPKTESERKSGVLLLRESEYLKFTDEMKRTTEGKRIPITKNNVVVGHGTTTFRGSEVWLVDITPPGAL